MVDLELRNILLSGNAARQTIIHFPNGEFEDITSGIHSGSMKLEEILCSNENLTFGECNASRFEAKIANIPDISDTIIYVYQIIKYDENKIKYIVDRGKAYIVTQDGKKIAVGRRANYTLSLFYGRIDSAELQTDRTHRVITAYDELYFKGDINCADWYKQWFVDNPSGKLKAFRDDLMAFVGIQQEVATLINDTMSVKETIDTKSLKFADIIKAICQINGVFGHIDRNGIFRYVDLTNIVDTYDVSDNYRSNDSKYESYTVKKIDKLQIRSEEEDIGAIVGTGDNPYIIQGNFLVYGKTASQLNIIATRIFNKIKIIEYRPIDASLIYSEPYITVGNGISLTTKRDGELVSSIILNNSMNGVQLIRQQIVSEGNEYRDEVVDDVNAEIYQLKGKTLKIVKTVDEYSVKLEDLEKGFSEFKVTVDEISSTVANNTNEISTIKQTVNSIELSVSNGTSSSTIQLMADGVAVSSETIRFKGMVTFTDLEESGSTVINGDNITTGQLDCELITANGEYVFNVTDRSLQIAYDSYFDDLNVLIGGGRVLVCQSDAELAFFGGAGDTQQDADTVSLSADTETIASALNKLVLALRAYNLVG